MIPKAFVAGHPIGHSRSPAIHDFWLKEHKLTGSYQPLDIEPEKLASLPMQIKNGSYLGGNITLPHKIAIIKFCDELTLSARAINAVNTLYLDQGRLIGDNTDAHGFICSLNRQAPRWQARTDTCMILGAGGASRAIAYALAKQNISNLILVNRTLSKMEKLAQVISTVNPGIKIQSGGMNCYEQYAHNIDLLVNTTSIGMHNTTFENLETALLPDNAIVYDIVYTPLQTPLLKQAKLNNLTTINGLGMLLYQAAPGFEKWFGIRPCVTDSLFEKITLDINRQTP